MAGMYNNFEVTFLILLTITIGICSIMLTTLLKFVFEKGVCVTVWILLIASR